MPQIPPGQLEHPLLGAQPWLEAAATTLCAGFLTGTPPDSFLRLLDKPQLEYLAWFIVSSRALLIRYVKETEDLETAHWMESALGPWQTAVLTAIHRQLDRLDQPEGLPPGNFKATKARVGLEDVAGRVIHLTRAGENTYKGTCPFHAGGAERTASFVVFIASQRWRCFGACATGGDVFDFMKRWREQT